jgi:large subunit ribosomal protein L9
MKVILLQDIKKVGKKFETKTVANGYALNFLIPRKLAEVSTESSLKKVESQKVKMAAEIKIQEDLLMKNLKNIDGISISISQKASEKGHLFKGIHKEDLIEAIKAQTKLDITPEYIVLEKPLKEVGEFTVEAKVQDKTAKFKVVVSAE